MREQSARAEAGQDLHGNAEPPRFHSDACRSDQLLRRPTVALRLDVSVRTLERWAQQGIGPRPVKAGPRFVRYRASEVEAWLDQAQEAVA
ncbi:MULTISPECIES: helix-turn-helix transcriptional regulator [Micromonospora]|uniref:helix-turn-helix transcriptional regulator n=1 Tax=Micromonospora TaxID=1873 RepID=UPI0034E0364F